MSHDFPMIFPLKWPFWSRTSQPWAHPGRRLPPRPLSHQLLLQWLCNRQNFAPYLCKDANAICVFYVFRIRMCLFFFSLSISRFSFKLLNFEYISHQWWVFHESVKRWYKSIHIYCDHHIHLYANGSTKHVSQAEQTRYFSIFAAVLAWLFASIRKDQSTTQAVNPVSGDLEASHLIWKSPEGNWTGDWGQRSSAEVWKRCSLLGFLESIHFNSNRT